MKEVEREERLAGGDTVSCHSALECICIFRWFFRDVTSGSSSPPPPHTACEPSTSVSSLSFPFFPLVYFPLKNRSAKLITPCKPFPINVRFTAVVL